MKASGGWKDIIVEVFQNKNWTDRGTAEYQREGKGRTRFFKSSFFPLPGSGEGILYL